MFFNNVRIVGNTILFSANRLDDSVPMVKVLSVMNRWYECEVPFDNVEGWTIEFKVSEAVDTYEGPTSGYGSLRVLISTGNEGYVYNLGGHMDCGFFQYYESFTPTSCCGFCNDMWGMCECIPCDCGCRGEMTQCSTKCPVCDWHPAWCNCYSGFEPVEEESFAEIV